MTELSTRPASIRAFALPLAVAALLAVLPGTSRGTGAWQTHIRVKDYTDLLVTDEAVWCATAGAGLLRFDRATRTFTTVTREPGTIADNQITSLAFDRVGRLWVGTFSAGASRLSADGSAWELVNAFDGLPVDSVTTMAVVGDTLWIGTRGGIALWDGRQVLGSLPDGNTVSFDTTFASPAITGVVQLGDTLWLSTPRGVGFARTGTNLTDWRKANDGLPTLTVERLATDGRTLYALADGDVHHWMPDSLKWASIGFIGNVFNLESEYGTVLASTSLAIYRHREGGPQLFLPIVGSPVAAAGGNFDTEAGVDPTGSTQHYAAGALDTLWEQPAAGGRWTPHVPSAPPGNTYANIVIDGPRVYAATRNEGIGRWDGSDWFAWPRVSCVGGCPNTFRNPNEVFAMLVDRAGQKWVSCWGTAIERFDDWASPPLFEHKWDLASIPGDGMHTIAFGAALDSSGGAGGRWFGMDTPSLGTSGFEPLGLDLYDSTGAHVGNWAPGTPAGSLVRGGKIRAVTVDEDGRVWMGYAGAANSGVDHFVRRPEVGYDFRTVAGTTSMDVWAMVAHGDSVWVLTDRDLRRISRASVPPRLVTLSYETPAGRPLGMRLMDVAANGDVYVGTEEGVRRYRAGGGTEDFTIRNSPLASNDVRAVAVDRATGVIWFGTAEGLNRFDPGFTVVVPPAGTDDSLQVFPNPATLTGVGIQLKLQGTSEGYVGGVYDLRGRLLHRFTTSARGQVFWDGRDRNGVMARPGVYFVHADRDGRRARARFVLLH